MSEEIFGPILPIITIDNIEDIYLYNEKKSLYYTFLQIIKR